MRTETLPALIVINDFIINFNSVSYFQHGKSTTDNQHFIKFKMICGDYVNFDFKNVDEYNTILSNLLQLYRQNQTEKWQEVVKNGEKVQKNVEKSPKKLKIVPKNN
jgi:hypothetical protein